VSATPGSPDNSVAATVTIDASPLGKATVTAESGTHQQTQDVAVAATGGSFRLSYDGTHFTAPLAFDAPAVTVENAIKALPGIPTTDLTVASNGDVYQVAFRGLPAATTPSLLTVDSAALKPVVPADLVGTTVLITDGSAKNKSRIVVGALPVAPGSSQWV